MKKPEPDQSPTYSIVEMHNSIEGLKLLVHNLNVKVDSLCDERRCKDAGMHNTSPQLFDLMTITDALQDMRISYSRAFRKAQRYWFLSTSNCLAIEFHDHVPFAVVNNSFAISLLEASLTKITGKDFKVEVHYEAP